MFKDERDTSEIKNLGWFIIIVIDHETTRGEFLHFYPDMNFQWFYSQSGRPFRDFLRQKSTYHPIGIGVDYL